MGFLSKIFSRQYVIRAHRFRIKEIHNLTMAVDGVRYAISNISMSGIGLSAAELVKSCSINDEILITLKISDNIFDASARIVRINRDFLGLAITSHLNIYEENVKDFFKSEASALKMYKKDADQFTDDYVGQLQWYYADTFHELLFRKEGEDVGFFKINFQGLIFNSQGLGDLTVFQVITEDDDDKSRLRKNTALEPFEIKSKAMLECLIRFLDEIQHLELKFKRQIIQRVEEKVSSLN